MAAGWDLSAVVDQNIYGVHSPVWKRQGNQTFYIWLPTEWVSQESQLEATYSILA